MNTPRFLTSLLVLCSTLHLLAATWHVAEIGGGGYITGMIQDPRHPEVIYARSDVGGVFKSTDGARTWQACNAGMDKWYQHHVRSIAMDPVNTQVVYRAGGELVGWQHTGYIHRSTDGGQTWQLVCDSVDYFGNGSTRMCGEMIAVDPADHLHVMAGSYSRGLWESTDQGITWHCVGLRGERITFVRYFCGQLYVGTAFDGAIGNRNTIRQCMDYQRNLPSRLYVMTADGHLRQVFQSREVAFYDIAVLHGGATILLATNRCVMRSTDYGATFRPSGLPDKAMYQTLALDPHHEGRVYTARKFSEQDTLRIYVSDNAGQDWHLWTTGITAANLHELPTYAHADCAWLGASIACLMPDCADPDKMYLSNWWGVTVSYDNGRNFHCHNFKGLNILCGECILRHPVTPGKVYLAMADHGPLVSTDAGQTYRLMSSQARTSARTLAASRTNPEWLMWSEGSKRTNEGTPVRLTTDGGLTVTQVCHHQGNSYVQCLMEDPQVDGRYWMMQEGLLNDSVERGGIYRSDDHGQTWQRTASPYPAYMNCLPHRREYIDGNFLPVVSYQTKNASGTNHLMSADCFRRDVLYVGEWTEGLWRSDDAGRTWSNISTGLPRADADSARVLSFVHADPLRRGGLYAGYWKAGLWYSRDYGHHWKQISLSDQPVTNAVAMDKQGQTICVACSQHVSADRPAALFISTDNGQHWTDLYDAQLGALRIIDIALDADCRRIHVTTCGNGAYYVDY